MYAYNITATLGCQFLFLNYLNVEDFFVKAPYMKDLLPEPLNFGIMKLLLCIKIKE